MTQITQIVGIDVAKDTLAWCIRGLAAGTALNTPDGCLELCRLLQHHGTTLAVLEASGGYERSMALALHKTKIAARVVDPKRVRDFAKAAGRRAKNDPIDADTIAWFGETFDLEGAGAPDLERQELAALVSERRALTDMRSQSLNRGQHKRPQLCRQLRKDLVAHINRAIATLDAAIAELIARNEKWAERARLLRSVPGLGPQSLAALIAWLPELGHASSAQIAALVGVAPYDDDSGQHSGTRRIAGGRKQLRGVLYMAILGAATQHNPVLNAYYRRLIDKGKLKKVALVACLRKLLHILVAMVARQQLWNPPTQPHPLQP